MIPADILIVYLVALALSIAVLTFFKTRRSRMYLPPGYYPWPLLGNLPKLFRQEPHLFVTEVGEYFGGVITFYKGSTPIVMFNRLDQAVEAFVNQSAVFSDRSIPPLWERSFTSKGKPSLAVRQWPDYRSNVDAHSIIHMFVIMCPMEVNILHAAVP